MYSLHPLAPYYQSALVALVNKLQVSHLSPLPYTPSPIQSKYSNESFTDSEATRHEGVLSEINPTKRLVTTRSRVCRLQSPSANLLFDAVSLAWAKLTYSVPVPICILNKSSIWMAGVAVGGGDSCRSARGEELHLKCGRPTPSSFLIWFKAIIPLLCSFYL